MGMTPEDRLRQMMARAGDTGPRVGEGSIDAAAWDAFARKAHRRLFVSRAAVATLAVVLVAGGVTAGVLVTRDNPVVPPPQPPAASPSPTESATQEVPAGTRDVVVELWFTEGELLGRSVSQVTAEDGSPQVTASALAAATALFEGPPQGMGTAIPSGASPPDGVGVDEQGVATVHLRSDFESGGGSLGMQMRVAQVVFTLTQFPEIEGVLFTMDGEQVSAIGGEGIDTSEPLTRRDFDDFAPAIVVDTPEIGDEVASGDLVAGTANVFEATVNIRLLDEDGKVLVETFTTATCGTGCRGEYSEPVEFAVPHRQTGTIEVLTYSAEDGSPQFTVEIPVTLVP